MIAYIESDVEKVADLIRKSFRVHAKHSLDKTTELGIDRIGYRSIHQVCDLGDDRCILPEYIPFKDMLFEIQVRTVLQHAWAEIEHDRNYKFSGTLPDNLQRRLYLAAGALELVDREFNSIAQDIDSYSKEIASQTREGKLDIPINTKSLQEYLKTKFSDDSRVLMGHLERQDVVSELSNFGIKSLKDLDVLITPEFFEQSRDVNIKTTDLGLLRDIMMYEDFDRYFKHSWQAHWHATGPSSVRFLTKKYDKRHILEKLRSLNIAIEEDIDR